MDIAMDGAGSFALVVDSSNFVLRYITIASALVTTFAGRSTSHSSSVDGVGTAATFNQPKGLALNQAGTLALIVSDSARAVSVRATPLHRVVTIGAADRLESHSNDCDVVQTRFNSCGLELLSWLGIG